MRVATIDVGTNTVLLLVAERGQGGSFRAVAERMELTRLGEGVDRSHRLAPAAVERTVAAIGSFAALARSLGASALVITATSAARDAKNGHEFLERARLAAGASVEILSGDEEAALVYEASRWDFAKGGEPLAVMDIGGGSTELVYGSQGAVSFRRSLDLGAVRLTERCLPSDPPTTDELEALRAQVRGALEGVPSPPKGATLVGIAGTVTTLCALHLGLSAYDGSLVHGKRLRASEIQALAARLAAVDLQRRKRFPGLPEKRADVIVAGAELAAAVMAHLGFEELVVSDRGLRWGLLHARFGAVRA